MKSTSDVLAVEGVPPSLPAGMREAVRPKWWAGLLAAEVFLVAVVVLVGVLVTKRLDAQRDVMAAQNTNTVELQSELKELKGQTTQLTAELMNLRQTVASSTGEDVIFLKVLLLKSDIDPQLARTIARHTHRNAQLYGRDPNLVLAIMDIESDFDPKITSHVGAQGLMQVMPQWKKVLGITGDLYDPETNIQTGLQVLGFYFEMYRDLELVLTAYNRGPGPVDFALRKGQDARNGYAAKVITQYERLKQFSAR